MENENQEPIQETIQNPVQETIQEPIQEPIQEERKGLSIASMVLGLVGLVLFAIPCGILAVIFSVIGKKKGGKGFATAGLILGIIDLVFGLFAFIVSFSTLLSVF